ncbi:MAG: hypothetical protein AABX37_03000, partial [Nanoarchaeota archaeon]
KILICPQYDSIDGPLIFLMGPILGSYRWQDDAIQLIKNSAPELNIASPRRAVGRDTDFTEAMYIEQVDWETCYLRRAGKEGVILCWLAKERKHNCESPYAQTSRFELGEWKMRHERDGSHLVVGIEEGFTNAQYIKRRLGQDCPDVPICSTLEDTCAEAITCVQG